MPIELMPSMPIVIADVEVRQRPDDQARRTIAVFGPARSRGRIAAYSHTVAMPSSNVTTMNTAICRRADRRQVARGKLLIHLRPGDRHVQDELADVHDQHPPPPRP